MTTFDQSTDPRFARPTFTERRIEAAAAGFGIASLLGLAVVVLAVVGLDGVLPRTMAAVGIIALGVALILEGSGIGAHLRSLRRGDVALRNKVASGALGVELVAGVGAVVLGLVAFFVTSPWLMLTIATIAIGVAYLLASGGIFQFGALAGPARRSSDVALRSLVATYASARPIAGMAGAILGILALTDVGYAHQMTFVFVALIAMGAAGLLGGLAAGGAVARRPLW